MYFYFSVSKRWKCKRRTTLEQSKVITFNAKQFVVQERGFSWLLILAFLPFL